MPDNTLSRDDGWKAFRIQGVLDFSLIGILSRITTLLADNKIGVFAISTYNTDYILTKKENFEDTLQVLSMGMSFQEAIELYRGIYHRFEKVEGKPWGVNGAMIELSKQVGDLSKCIMLKEEYYAYKGERPVGLEKNIGNELADIFGQLIRIADCYGIDLEEAHAAAREEEDRDLKSRGV